MADYSTELRVGDLIHSTTHVFRATLGNAPETDVTLPHHTKQAVIHPGYLEITVDIHSGVRRTTVEITGPTMRKDGQLSESHRRGLFALGEPGRYPTYSPAPKWLRDLSTKILTDAGLEAP